ncbi:MAG: hypothetical protein WC804_04200 [Sphingomonas sp.]|jgi:hypothetical protein|uniref:hypothetical protein n=1 Tax=Sphingomonas sp. TaxID=28214 RepID=UPI0035635C04
MARWLILLLALPLGGCLTPVKAPPNGGLITYWTEPGFCMGACPTFHLTVNSDGKGRLRHFDGRGELLGMRPIHVSRGQYEAFEMSLAPYRPVGEKIWYDAPPCKGLMSDQGQIHIQWDGQGRSDRLVFNLGCEVGDGNAMWNALDHAPQLLGLKGLPDPASGSVATTRIR